MSISWGIRLNTLADVEAVQGSGFGTIQLPVEAVMDVPDSELETYRADMASRGINFKVFEAPLPKGVQVTEQGFNTYHWTEYLGNAIRKIASLGCSTLVWGDGRSRLLPVEGDVSTAKEHFYQFMFILCGMAERFDIEVCLEPLGPRRTNFINSLDELQSCISLIDKNNLSIMISPRDLAEMNLEVVDILRGNNHIGHVHLENPGYPASSQPPAESDGYDYMKFLGGLQDRGYTGVISLPNGSSKESLTYCKQLWDMLALHQ